MPCSSAICSSCRGAMLDDRQRCRCHYHTLLCARSGHSIISPVVENRAPHLTHTVTGHPRDRIARRHMLESRAHRLGQRRQNRPRCERPPQPKCSAPLQAIRAIQGVSPSSPMASRSPRWALMQHCASGAFDTAAELCTLVGHTKEGARRRSVIR